MWYQTRENRLTLTLHVQPGAKRTRVAGLHGDALKIKVAAAAVEGQANSRLLEFLRRAFQVPASCVALKQGERARRKVVEIRDTAVTPESLLAGEDAP